MKEKFFSFFRNAYAVVAEKLQSRKSLIEDLKIKSNDAIRKIKEDFRRITSRLPSLLEIHCILKTFSFREKVVFLISVFFLSFSALGILWNLDRSFAVEIPKSGGTLNEGIIGTPRFVNPLLAASDADRDLSNLVYSGLMRADGKGGLIPDLAEKYEISKDGLSYTFTLKKDLHWSDGEPLTIDDIIFTIKEAKNPIVKSNQRASWEGVGIEKIDDNTIRFSLKQPYSPFMENTTMGIIPSHIWEEIPEDQMSLTDFNIQPIGSGPYKISDVSRDSLGIIKSYALKPNKYFILGKPHINEIMLKFYPSENKLVSAYENGEMESVGGISPQNIMKIKNSDNILESLLLPRVFAIFFNQNSAQILAKKEIRQALDLAIDKERITKEVLYNFGTIIEHPIPPGSIGALDYQEKEISYENNFKKATEIIEKAGWKINEESKIFEKVEKKGNKKETIKLEISLNTSNAPELMQVAELVRQMWEKLGIKVNLKIFEIGDLNQDVIRPRRYDALLFGIMMGKDPDPFAFWHSSQRNDPGLNIALYTNITADKLLEEARIISDTKKREEKYRAFQEQVEKDIPAIFLYSPQFIYLIPESLKGFETDTITIPSERFSQVYKWYLGTEKIWKIFAK